MSLSARIARTLERGPSPRAPLRAASSLWGRVASRGVARPLRLPDGARVVTVGGATLGGSGKTPVALACATELACEGAVVLVGHAYRASPDRARVVEPDDPVGLVGDEALACARLLCAAGSAARVVVAPRRQDAVDFAATLASTLVLDGVAQTSPVRAHRALLAVDAEAPWGAGACPPLGDLRAPRGALLDACDEVVAVRDPLAPVVALPRCRFVDVVTRGVWLGTSLVGWPELRALRVGLATSIARPTRVLATLARRGVVPAEVAFGGDHAALELPDALVDLWLTTAKCAAHAPRKRHSEGAPLAYIDYTVARLDPMRGSQ